MAFLTDDFLATALPFAAILSNNQLHLIQKGMRRMKQKQFGSVIRILMKVGSGERYEAVLIFDNFMV